MKRSRIFPVYSVLALVLAIGVAKGEPVQVQLTIDSYNHYGPVSPLPYLNVYLDSSNSAFAGHVGPNNYAGIFSGLGVNAATGETSRYYFLCSELNRSIYIGQSYTFSVYDSYQAAPIQNGNPPHSGELISDTQKSLVEGVFKYLGIADEIKGFTISGGSSGQDLSGIIASDVDVAKLLSLDNEHAAAAQLAIWEIVHEPYDGRGGISLTDGQLNWRQNDGQPFSQGFKDLFDHTVDGAFSNAGVPIPEPAVMSLMAVGVAGLVLRRPAKSRI